MISKIMYFGASWCGQCQVVKKHLEKVAIPVEKYDVDEDEALADTYNIQSVPTLLFVDQEGRCVETKVGAISLEEITKVINIK